MTLDALDERAQADTRNGKKLSSNLSIVNVINDITHRCIRKVTTIRELLRHN